MRHAAFWLGLVILAPIAHALVAPPAIEPLLPDIDPLPADIKDADVLELLAPHWDVTPTRLPLVEADLAREPLSTSITRLAALGGFTLAPTDAQAYDALDPRVQLPVATLALATERAWLLIDAAFAAEWTQDEIQASILAMRAGHEPAKVLSPDQKEALVNAAILLSDTIETIVIPQLQAAAQNGAWPATPVADPVGVLRVGGTGNDVDPLDRILTIDARGNDTYYGNAGGGSAWISLARSSPDPQVHMVVPEGGFYGSHLLVARVRWGEGQEASLVDWFDVVAKDGREPERAGYRVALSIGERGTG